MNIQLKKKTCGRRRFLKTAPLSQPDDWLHELAQLKGWLAALSQFQQVGHKTYFEVSGSAFLIMIEVVGVPRNLEQKTLVLADVEAMDIFIYEFKNEDLFSIDLKTVLSMAGKIKATLNLGENKLADIFHVVLEAEKIALHFFRQKDYSQNLL